MKQTKLTSSDLQYIIHAVKIKQAINNVEVGRLLDQLTKMYNDSLREEYAKEPR